MRACMARSLLPIDVSFPGAPSLLASLQACPWRSAKVAWEGSCADMFSVKGEAGPGRSGCQGLASPGRSSFSDHGGQGELWALPQALWASGWTLVTADRKQGWQLDRMAFLSVRFYISNFLNYSSKMIKAMISPETVASCIYYGTFKNEQIDS